jgi:hypothetical protein
MAWALRLDTEATAGGVDDFHALGVSARKLLVDHLRSYGTRPGGLLSTAYASTIWAADSLLSWSDAFDDAEGREVASELARHIVRSEAVPGAGSARPDAAPRGFFSPCHLWLLLALHAGYKAPELTGAIQAVRDTTLHPPAQLRSVHAAGLNFSRAWGCHAAWALTGDVRHRETFAALVTGHLDLPGYWRDSYERYGHWVAQFGVFAIALAQNTTDAVGDNEETT